VKQQVRVAQGVRSGELTARETVRLERREARIQADVARSRAQNGGTLTPADRVRIEARQDAMSRAIYRQKHDAQRR
jgi:hypothetical protein